MSNATQITAFLRSLRSVRRFSRRSVSGEVLLDIAFRVKPPEALLEFLDYTA